MATYRGTDGFLAQGGAVVGTSLLQGAVAQSETEATLDGTGFNGVVRPGDTFTVAGDAQTYTVVTGGVVGATTPNEVDITFTPAVSPSGGWADNAQVTFASNAVSQVRSWSLQITRPELETTAMQDTAESFTLDIAQWSGTARAWLDYGDSRQKALIDQAVAGTEPTALALLLAANDGKQFWGDVVATSAEVTSEKGALVEITFGFRGTGAAASNWN